MRFPKLCVIGLGYIGLPTASTFATCDLDVLGVDVNLAIIETIMAGGIHIHEPGLYDLVKSGTQSTKLKVATAPDFADAFIIAVPTPFYDGKKSGFKGSESRHRIDCALFA